MTHSGTLNKRDTRQWLNWWRARGYNVRAERSNVKGPKGVKLFDVYWSK